MAIACSKASRTERGKERKRRRVEKTTASVVMIMHVRKKRKKEKKSEWYIRFIAVAAPTNNGEKNLLLPSFFVPLFSPSLYIPLHNTPLRRTLCVVCVQWALGSCTICAAEAGDKNTARRRPLLVMSTLSYRLHFNSGCWFHEANCQSAVCSLRVWLSSTLGGNCQTASVSKRPNKELEGLVIKCVEQVEGKGELSDELQLWTDGVMSQFLHILAN